MTLKRLLFYSFFLFPFLIFVIFQSSSLNAKTQRYNYDFMSEVIKNFRTLSLSDLEKKYPKKEVIFEDKKSSIIKFSLKVSGHFFPVFIQTQNKEKSDFYISLPTYFLHDPFLEVLKKDAGKESSFLTKETSALYIWENTNSKKVYNSDCTITCFPVYYTEILKNPSSSNTILTNSIWQKIIQNEL